MRQFFLYILLINLNYSFANIFPSKSNVLFVKHIQQLSSSNHDLDTVTKLHDTNLVEYYRTKMFQSDNKKQFVYSDSLLIAALKTKDNNTIGKAYLSRGILFYNQKQLQKALDNYLLADEYISQTHNQYTLFKIKYAIAQTKYYLGFYHEAIALFKECTTFFAEENDRAYLNSIHSLGLCYARIKKTDSCSHYNKLGVKLSKELNVLSMIAYFNHSEGINLYYKTKYNEAIQKLKTVLPQMIHTKDFANESVAYFYIGKSYSQLGLNDKAIDYFKKVDKIFEKEDYIRPDLRESYELLIDYYKSKNDINSEMLYINQLLKVDKVLGQNYKYLLQKIVKEYDTKTLLKSKQTIENRMAFRTKLSFGIISCMTLVITLLIYRHYKNKRLFNRLMTNKAMGSTKDKHQKESKKIKPQVINDINPEAEMEIVKKLEKFELNKKYLDKDMTLTSMASLLNTNTKYVSRVIAKHRGKGTIDYITDLKINYIVEKLKTDSKFRNYTNKALGEEAGFGSTQNFTKAFKTRIGISPTYFINQLKNL